MSHIIISLPETAGVSFSSVQQWLETSIDQGSAEVHSVKLPDFKVATLDSLVAQSEELSKLDGQLYSSIGKVEEILDSIGGKVNKTDIYDDLEKFNWNGGRFRLNKSTDELIKMISSQGLQLDADLRNQYQSYITAKSNLNNVERKQNGDLSVKSLHDIVKKDDYIDSEHLTTIFLAVPNSLVKEFYNTYETASPFVVPRSARLLNSDSEFHLFAVTLFKKYESEFLHAARENKWIPRNFKYSESTIEGLRNEYSQAKKDEFILKNDLLRLTKEAFTEIFLCWSHIKFLRVFIESVLRYGLPPNFYCFVLKPKHLDAAKKELIEKFGYLGGKSGANDDLHEYAGIVDTDYEPFVIYTV